jgi:hypothetical protein
MPGDLYLYSFSIAISTLKELGSGADGLNVCISACLTPLPSCIPIADRSNSSFSSKYFVHLQADYHVHFFTM